ncbi:MAG: DUF1800 domain-containing protein [Pseudomonadota bacterium]
MIKIVQIVVTLAAVSVLAACKISVAPDDGEAAPTAPEVTTTPPPEPTPEPTPEPAPEPAPTPLPLPDDQDAVKFFNQASFGGSEEDIAELQSIGIEAWILDQIDQPIVSVVDRIEAHFLEKSVSTATFSELFWERAVHGDDQLRQRVAYALSQIVVVSLEDSTIAISGVRRSFSTYLDILQNQALGNYCTLIKDVSLNPVMGIYLTHLGNRREDLVTGFVPDENYAREVMQLFTIGLENLNSDGTGQGTETYTIDDVQGLAAVFTGLSWADTNFGNPMIFDDNRYLPMEGFTVQHEDGPKSFLGTTIDLGTDALVSVDAALDYLLAHPNVAPFVSKQLIQKLVTSNPSPAYVERVASAFEAGLFEMPGGQTVGTGARCDMAATVTAILLDEEARGVPTNDNHGKLRTPILRLAHYLRAFRAEQAVTTTGPLPTALDLTSLNAMNRFGMNAYFSPSVFNDFRPGYVAPNTESAAAGLVAPEFQIVTSNTLITYINTMESFIDGPSLDGSNANVANLDFSSIDTDVDNVETYVSRLDRLLTGGTLSDSNRQAIIDSVSLLEIAGSDQDEDRRERREVALMMMVTSPEFMVQR